MELLRLKLATLYYQGMFGVLHKEVRELVIEQRPYAQYPGALHVAYIEKGKRKPSGMVQTNDVTLVVFDGHGHEIPRPSVFDEEPDGTRTTRHASFSSEWNKEFDRALAAYLASGHQLAADYRGFDTGYEPTNNQGLTLKQWYAAAGLKPVDVKPQHRHAWARSETPPAPMAT
jgi:hypothetical protein